MIIVLKVKVHSHWFYFAINYYGINKYWHYYMDKHMIFSKPFCGQNANF